MLTDLKIFISRGTSQENKMAAFRECYGKLYELRSLASDVPVIALTATATRLTRDTILNILHMECFVEIKESPNKTNIRYVVHCMDKKAEHEEYFAWLTDTLRTEGQNCVRTIVYCQTIKQCSIIYATMSGLLGKENMTSSNGYPLVEMLHSCTPEANKKIVLESFQQEHGSVRLLIATIAFGMGINCKGVQRVIHYGPSKNVEAYVQETGRAGRDSGESVAFLLYHGVLLNHVHSDIKSFIKTKECRRMTLMKHFDADAVNIEIPHKCCDICAASCDCGQPDCFSYCKYPSQAIQNVTVGTHQQRSVSADSKKLVENALNQYHKILVLKLLNTSANGEVKTLTNLHFMLGFSEHQIFQVLENIASIFTLSDIYKSVEVWDKRHAQKVLSVISIVFGDVTCDRDLPGTHFESSIDFDDEYMDEWDEIFQDSELFDMIVDNVSLSQLDESISMLEETLDNSTESLDDEIPADILAAIVKV